MPEITTELSATTVEPFRKQYCAAKPVYIRTSETIPRYLVATKNNIQTLKNVDWNHGLPVYLKAESEINETTEVKQWKIYKQKKCNSQLSECADFCDNDKLLHSSPGDHDTPCQNHEKFEYCLLDIGGHPYYRDNKRYAMTSDNPFKDGVDTLNLSTDFQPFLQTDKAGIPEKCCCTSEADYANRSYVNVEEPNTDLNDYYILIEADYGADTSNENFSMLSKGPHPNRPSNSRDAGVVYPIFETRGNWSKKPDPSNNGYRFGPGGWEKQGMIKDGDKFKIFNGSGTNKSFFCYKADSNMMVESQTDIEADSNIIDKWVVEVISDPTELTQCDQYKCTNEADCNNHGTASGYEGSCSCECESGWEGDDCSVEKCTNKADCNNHGTASGVKGSCSCECESGWEGDDCSKEKSNMMLIGIVGVSILVGLGALWFLNSKKDNVKYLPMVNVSAQV